MDTLWTPWRYSYISKDKPAGRPGVPEALQAWPGPSPDCPDTGCVFCNLIGSVTWAAQNGFSPEDADAHGLIVGRYPTGFLCLNRFPYASGHVLAVPWAHKDSLLGLSEPEALDLMAATRRLEAALRSLYKPHGINLGMNLGEAAGAGVAGHLHLHILPRWAGDTNFMTVVAETRVLPETLDITWRRLRDTLENPVSPTPTPKP